MYFGTVTTPQAVFVDPAAQLAPLSPIASLAASNPPAALSALSPVLGLFNPAVNPRAALLAFNPGAAPTLALIGGAIPSAAAIPAVGKVPVTYTPWGKYPAPLTYAPWGKYAPVPTGYAPWAAPTASPILY
jgi:hypothetical protein